MSDGIGVVIADDHPLMRAALKEAVEARPELKLLGEASGGEEALERLRELDPDVALLDVRMGDMDGLQVLGAVKREGLRTRILFLSTFTESATVYDALAMGASGYIDKGAYPEQIVDAILAVAQGRTVLSAAVEGGIVEQIRLRGREHTTNLTPRELEVLRLIAAGMTGPQIAERLYVALSTVKTHVQHIYEKLGASDRASAVAEAMRQGLVE